MEQALKKMNTLATDSLNFHPAFRAAVGNHEFTKSIQTAKEQIEKTKKEFLNYKNLGKKDQVSTEKIKDDISKAMEQLSTFNLDQWMEDAIRAYEMVAPDIRELSTEENKRNTQPAENMDMRKMKMPKIPGFHADMNAVPAIRISNQEIVVGGVSFNKEFLKELQSLAELVKAVPLEELSAAEQKEFKQRIEKFIEQRLGNKRVNNTVDSEKTKERDLFKLQMQ